MSFNANLPVELARFEAGLSTVRPKTGAAGRTSAHARGHGGHRAERTRVTALIRSQGVIVAGTVLREQTRGGGEVSAV